MAPEVCQRSPLTNKIIDQQILIGLHISIEDCRKGQSVVAVRLRVRDSIDLNYSRVQMQTELASETASKYSRYCIHPISFKSVDRQEPRPSRAN